MTIQTINIGNIVNDGLGDDLRTAFQKVNANFSALDAELTVSAENIGTASDGVGLFKQRTGGTLEFKRLKEGRNIQIDEYDTYLEIKNTASDAFIRFDTDAGTVTAASYPAITLEGYPAPNSVSGQQDIEVTALGSSVRFKTVIPVTDILTTYDFGFINGTFNNAMQFAFTWSNIEFGDIENPSTVGLDCGSI
jgi:hypothetical protein